MLKNKEIKLLILAQFFIFLFICLLGYGLHKVIYTQYKQELIKNNSYLVSAIIESHPEYKEELMESIITGKGNLDKGLEILTQYGLDSIESLDYLHDFDALNTNLFLYEIIFIIITFILLSILYWWFVIKQYEKMNHLGNYMNKVLLGDYSMDIRDYEEGQVSRLKNDIYKLTVKLKEQSDNANKEKVELEQILSDISHQLRTPLTSMYVIHDLLEKEDIDSTMKKEFLKKDRKQLERISWLVTSLLKMSRLDSGSVVLKEETILLSQVVKDALDPLLIPIELKNINVQIENAEIPVMVDIRWTTEAFVNILKNAYEHTPEFGTITIQVTDNPIYTEVNIKDTGEGILDKDLPHIFKRFYTGSSNKESIGIGLHMAKKIIEKEGGDIMVTSSKGVGTTFHIKFYKNVMDKDK